MTQMAKMNLPKQGWHDQFCQLGPNMDVHIICVHLCHLRMVPCWFLVLNEKAPHCGAFIPAEDAFYGAVQRLLKVPMKVW